MRKISIMQEDRFPADIYLLKICNENTRTIYEN